MSRRAAKVCIATCIWTLYVWITRMWNIAHDDHPFGFKAVHGVLAVISIAFGLAVGVIGWRALKTPSAGNDRREPVALQQRPEA
jgi:hypothetical protein